MTNPIALQSRTQFQLALVATVPGLHFGRVSGRDRLYPEKSKRIFVDDSKGWHTDHHVNVSHTSNFAFKSHYFDSDNVSCANGKLFFHDFKLRGVYTSALTDGPWFTGAIR